MFFVILVRWRVLFCIWDILKCVVVVGFFLLFREIFKLLWLVDYEEIVRNWDSWKVDDNFIEDIFILGKMVFCEVFVLLLLLEDFE